MPIDWRTPLDLYCERTDPGVWSEPINALSNLAYLAAGYLILARLGGTRLGLARFLGVLAMLVGVGSATFHTTAQRWSWVLDIAFIAVFVVVFFGAYLRLRVGIGIGATLIAMAAYLLASAGLANVLGRVFDPALSNGTEIYAGPLLGLVAIAWHSRRNADRAAPEYLIALTTFAVALVLRTLDQRLCASLPIGTHFAWHLLTATLLWLLARGLLAYHPLPRRQ